MHFFPGKHVFGTLYLIISSISVAVVLQNDAIDTNNEYMSEYRSVTHANEVSDSVFSGKKQ